MKFTLAAVSAFVAAAAANALPAAFTLVTDGGAQIETNGEYLYKAGAVAPSTGANLTLAIFRNDGNGMVTYTAADSSPTAFQYLYIVEKEVYPVGLTIPHSSATSGGVTTGVNETSFGVYTQEGVDYFAAKGRQGFAISPDDPSQRVYWIGLDHSRYEQTRLAIKECKGC
ncbi:hypothetical protein K490DRAFT_58657 [Saccharata proteae CBS 121410]|uniref:Uncharacterized protein n=1 Tax=Saccharata proteae CBS 121410 TaxID=1314787 RepID=A0A9P4HSA2_9PEZI|nr:hypothetical protein K490DRAFT_58657 [Saccharata proteae CBS 121410]